jgi:hypothetical protein
MEPSHGFWKRRVVVVIGYPAANHYLACSFHASLITARRKKNLGVAVRQPPIVFGLLVRPYPAPHLLTNAWAQDHCRKGVCVIAQLSKSVDER